MEKREVRVTRTSLRVCKSNATDATHGLLFTTLRSESEQAARDGPLASPPVVITVIYCCSPRQQDVGQRRSRLLPSPVPAVPLRAAPDASEATRLGLRQ